MNPGDTVHTIRPHKGGWLHIAGMVLALPDGKIGVLCRPQDLSPGDRFPFPWVVTEIVTGWRPTIEAARESHAKQMADRHRREAEELAAVGRPVEAP